MTIAIFASWRLKKRGDAVFIPSTHYSYLNYVANKYDKVVLVCPMVFDESQPDGICIIFENVEIVPLPNAGSYMRALKEFFTYKTILREVCGRVDLVYCRVPDPFPWLPALLFKKKCIMHFVGDTIDATKHNEKWSWLKKAIMLIGYMPEYLLTLRAARKSRVFTNGPHIAEELQKKGISATPVISSTISEKNLRGDFIPLPIASGITRITYVGYVRYAKGMSCLMDFCKLLRDHHINYHFNLIGSGEMFDDVKSFFEKEGLLNDVTMYGHIDNKDEMNQILRNSDLFFFPSLSEGSPRVVIEAMSQGTPVMSTPVGSLPGTFKDGETIRYFEFNNALQAVGIVKEYILKPELFDEQRQKAFELVATNYTIEKFLSKVFSYDA